MAYIAPLCGDVNFNISRIWESPVCGFLDFNFGGVSDLAIRSANARIKINSSKMSIFDGIIIDSSNVDLNFNAQKSVIDLVWPIQSENIRIATLVNHSFIRIMPDIISSGIRLVTRSSKSSVGGALENNLPFGKSSGMSTRWENGVNKDIHKRMSWNTPTDIRNNKEISRNIIDRSKDLLIISSWFSLGVIDNTTLKSYSIFDTFDKQYTAVNISLIPEDKHSEKKWGSGLEEIANSLRVQWFSPEEKDRHIAKSYDSPKSLDETLSFSWQAPVAKDKHNSANWGPFSYYTLCYNSPYIAPPCNEIVFEFPNKYGLIEDVCSGLRFNVNSYSSEPRCAYNHFHSGVRDNYTPPTITPGLVYPERKEVYYMLNTVLVEELITRAPIEVLAIDAKIDRGSWLWSFNITVASKCYLDLIKPIDGVMGHIKINMNGYIWYCTVEGWSESRTFGSQSWTITGRSPSMMFGDPISDTMTGTISTGSQGQQIIENIVSSKVAPQHWPAALSTWTAKFTDYTTSGKVITGFEPFANWYIPGNTVSYVDQPEIEVIKELADAIGAYVQTEPDRNELIIKPMFAQQPWTWNSTNSNITWKTLNESQMVEIGRSNSLKPYHQAIHVLGEAIGGSNDGTGTDASNTAIAVEVRRTNYSASTASYAQMITSPYITSVKAGLEKGRAELAQTGEWVNHTLRIGTLCPSGQSTGLFKTGDMVSVLERGAAWYGQVIGVSVVAANAGAGYAVEQTIEVEEYRSS